MEKEFGIYFYFVVFFFVLLSLLNEMAVDVEERSVRHYDTNWIWFWYFAFDSQRWFDTIRTLCSRFDQVKFNFLFSWTEKWTWPNFLVYFRLSAFHTHSRLRLFEILFPVLRVESDEFRFHSRQWTLKEETCELSGKEEKSAKMYVISIFKILCMRKCLNFLLENFSSVFLIPLHFFPPSSARETLRTLKQNSSTSVNSKARTW